MSEPMFSIEEIQRQLESKVPGSRVLVRDTTGTHDHFEAVIVSPSFEGKSPVERHRIVYAALGSAVGAEIHALSLKTLTPQEAERTEN